MPSCPTDFAGIEESFRVIVRVEGLRAMDWEARHHLVDHEPLAASASSAPPTGPIRRNTTRRRLTRSRASRHWRTLFERCDAIITPSTCGEAAADLVSVSNSAFNRVWTLMRGPCLTVPAFTGPNGMPVGLQIVGPVGEDERTIAIADWIAARLNPSA